MDIRQEIESSPAIRFTTAAFSDNFILTVNGVLNIYNNLHEQDCEKIVAVNILNQIQFACQFNISENTLSLINSKLLPSTKDVYLSLTVREWDTLSYLDYLQYLPNLTCLAVDLVESNEINKINKINQFVQLRKLSIGGMNVSINELIQHRSLRHLHIHGKIMDVQAIGKMPWIESLSLANQTLKSLDFLSPLVNLKEIHFVLGGTRNLESLPYIGKIEKLSFIRVKKLTIENLLPINRISDLKQLRLETLPHLTDLSWLENKNIKTEVIDCRNFKH